MIFSPDTASTELAPLLELDPHGSSDNDANNLQTSDGFGVRRGDFVFIHRAGTTNGLEKPKVPRIGELEVWVRENPFTEISASGWRKDLYDTGIHVATLRGNGELNETLISRPVEGDGQLCWCGEVTGVSCLIGAPFRPQCSQYSCVNQLNLDGTVEVTRPDWTVATYPLEQLTRLYDGIEQLEDEVWDGESDGYHSYSDGEEADQQWAMQEDGVWRPEEPSDEWEDISSTGEHADYDTADEMQQDTQDIMEVDQALWDSEDAEPTMHEIEPTPTPVQPAVEKAKPQPGPGPAKTEVGDDSEDLDSAEWSRFEILASAPPDHAFYSTPHAQPSKAFLGRLNREYRALKSSLPG